MSAAEPKSPAQGGRLKAMEYIGYALGDTASNFYFQMFNIFLIYYYVDVWGIPATSVALMMLVVRIFDAANDPVMGLIADRTNTRWGKFRPYLLFGAIPYGICGYLMFAGPDLSEGGKLIYAYITYGAMLACYTIINVPYSSLLGVISPSAGIRAKASSFRFVGAFSGGFLISLLVRPLVRYFGAEDEILGFQMTMAIFAVVSVAMFWITFGTTNERVVPRPNQRTNVKEELGELLRNFPWIMLLVASVLSTSFIALRSGATVFYFEYYVGDPDTPVFWGLDKTTVFLSIGMLAQITGTLGLSFIAERVDKKWAAAALCMVTGACFSSFYFLPEQQFVLLTVVNAVGYLCMGPTSALTWALYADVADYGEWKFGRRSTGLVFSASLFSIKTGVTVGGFLLPTFLAFFGYLAPQAGVAVVQQTPRALLGILLAFSVAPGLVAILKGAALAIYPLDQTRVKQIERELAARQTDEFPGAVTA